MSTRVRVLASKISEGTLNRLSYTAQVYDSGLSIHAPPLWTCEHRHHGPQTAYACALAWLDGAGLAIDLPRSSNREALG